MSEPLRPVGARAWFDVLKDVGCLETIGIPTGNICRLSQLCDMI